MVIPQRDMVKGASGALHGDVDLRLPFPGHRGSLTTTVTVDGQAMFDDGSGHMAATVSPRTPVELHFTLPAQYGTIVGNLDADGQVRIKLPVPGGVEQVDGEVATRGSLGLNLSLPTGSTVDMQAAIDGTASIRTITPGCFCLDAQASVDAPLAVQLPLAGGLVELDVRLALNGTSTLRIALPSAQGQIQAHGRIAGPVTFTLGRPDVRGQLTARGSINTPVTLSMVVPNGRAKLSAHDDITSEVELCVALPGGGEITARGELHSRVHGVVFLPSGHGKLQAAAPINTIVRLKEIALPHSQGALTVDIGLEGAAELTMEMPGHNAQLRLHFGATLPLAPLVRLVRHEVERHVRVEYFEVGPPWLAGAHDLVVPLYVEARKGVLAKVEIIAQFHIDPRSKLVELRSVQAHGLNAAGRAAAGLYLNRKVFKSMRRTRLFDPFTMLPPQARIDALAVKAASADAIVIEGDMTFDSARPSQDIAN